MRRAPFDLGVEVVDSPAPSASARGGGPGRWHAWRRRRRPRPRLGDAVREQEASRRSRGSRACCGSCRAARACGPGPGCRPRASEKSGGRCSAPGRRPRPGPALRHQLGDAPQACRWRSPAPRRPARRRRSSASGGVARAAARRSSTGSRAPGPRIRDARCRPRGSIRQQAVEVVHLDVWRVAPRRLRRVAGERAREAGDEDRQPGCSSREQSGAVHEQQRLAAAGDAADHAVALPRDLAGTAPSRRSMTRTTSVSSSGGRNIRSCRDAVRRAPPGDLSITVSDGSAH